MVQIPLWPFGVAFIGICFIPDVIRWARRRRPSEIRRRRALDRLWSDEVGVGGVRARSSSSVSRGPATDAGGYPRVVKTMHGVPREIVFGRVEPKDAA